MSRINFLSLESVGWKTGYRAHGTRLLSTIDLERMSGFKNCKSLNGPLILDFTVTLSVAF